MEYKLRMYEWKSFVKYFDYGFVGYFGNINNKNYEVYYFIFGWII